MPATPVQFPLPADATPVRRRPQLDMSVTGAVYAAMLGFMGLAAINSQANLLFGVFGLMIGILLVSYLISRLVLRRTLVERELPEHMVVGLPSAFTYRVTNGKRFWPSLSVTIAELDGADAFARQPQAYLLHVAAKMTATIPCQVVPRRRGLHHLDRYQVSTSFPFGFIKRADTRARREPLLIYPALANVHPRVLQLARSAENSGPMMRPRRGGVDEFYGVKEFRDGESRRWIYWRRSARTGSLVAKEMTHVSPPKLMIVLDSHMPDTSRDSVEATERAIAIAASLASHALEAGLPVGLAVWSDHKVLMTPNRGKRHRRELLTVLARLPRNLEHDVQPLLQDLSSQRKGGTSLFMVTPREVQLSLTEHSRGGMFVLSASSPQTRGWFSFDPAIDFSHCAPEVESAAGA